MKQFVQILPYSPSWPEEFEKIAVVLRKELGCYASRIDHIGSTAVPNLAAKDVIDIQMTVSELNDAPVKKIENLGFLMPPGIYIDHQPMGLSWSFEDSQKLFFRSSPDNRRIHLHVRVAGRSNQRYPLLFRDYLRVHPLSAAAYAELKKRLATLVNSTQNHKNYTEVKDPAVDLIYFAAETWASHSNWQPGPSDV